jgi:hypothetical protein
MATVHRFPNRDVLAPEDIRVAALAFEATLKSLDIVVEGDAARESVARYIMEQALQGERDPLRLRDGALAHLRAPDQTKNG